MAIGDNNNNGNANNGAKLFESTYYSRIRFKNGENKLCLTPYFRSGLLVLEISELKEGFKYDTVINIFLSPTKAKLFAEEIRLFKEYLKAGDIIPGKAFGVNAGMNEKVSFIGLHADAEKNIYITIGKIDGSGNITESATTSLNRDYHFALEWENINSMDVAKAFYDNIELDQLYELVTDFARHMNGSLAYSVADLTRFDTARVLRKMDPIYDKLGIERRGSEGGYNNNRGTNNFLQNSGRVNSNHTSIDSMESLFDEE